MWQGVAPHACDDDPVLRVLVLLVTLAGCGRIAFEPAGRAGVDGGTDGGTTSCVFGPWTAPRHQVATSSSSIEFSPALSADGLTLYFESDRPGSNGYDVWFATRPTGTDDFGPALFAGVINTVVDDRGPTLTSDGLTMYLYHQPAPAGGQLHRATRATITDLFGLAALVPELASVDVEGPAISPRGDELFFTQGTDLVRATFDGSTFQNVASIDELNTGSSQGYPSVSGDALELYFESARLDGTDDIWVARRPAIGAAFTSVARVDEVSVAGNNDADPEISRDGLTLVFASDRPGGLLTVVGPSPDLYLSTRACL